MKAFIVVCFALCAVALARPEEKYTDKYDNVDVTEVLRNPRLLGPYVKCLTDAGKCAPDAKELKGHIQEALENGCAKCTEIQKKRVEEVISYLINHEPQYWEQLTNKYDPQRKFTKQYEDQLKKIKA